MTQPPDFGAIHDTDQLLLNMTLSDVQEIMPSEPELVPQRLRELQRMAKANQDKKSSGTFQNNRGRSSFSSLHSGGSQFVLGDGSVRFISENLATSTLNRLGNKSDGNVIGEF